MSTTEPDPIVRVDALRVDIDGGRTIVKAVSFEIRPGQILGVVGESGSGKTTVGMTLLGYVREGAHIAGGAVRVDGLDVASADRATLRSLRGRSVAYVSQDPSAALNPALRIRTQLQRFVAAHDPEWSRAQIDERIVEVMTEVNLPSTTEFLRRFPHQLSGGQLQRVAIAMATLLKPPVVVLDEPTTGLDVTSQEKILQLVRTMCTEHGIAALYVTHDLAVVADIADTVMVMRDGRVEEQGTAQQIFQDPQAAYTKELLAAAPDLADADLSIADDVPVDPNAELSVRGLSASYGTRTVLHDISFDLAPGECLALVGESGSGKSTLSKCLIGLHPDYTGDVALTGEVLPHKAIRRSRAVRKHMQYIFQSPHTSLNPRKTIAESVALVHEAVGGSRRTRTAEIRDVLDRVGLTGAFADMYPAQLSGGQRQRASIARALIAKPRVLICDEVTSALDVVVQASILDLLRKLQEEEGLAMVFVTHNLAVVGEIADRVIVLKDGRVVEAGTTGQILGAPGRDYTTELVGHTLSVQRVAADRWNRSVA